MTKDSLLSPPDAFNRALEGNLHPPGWRNPTPRGRYHLVVVGAGTAGLVSAAGAAALGARVALVEKHLLGGDCTSYGCVPSKALIRSARAARAVSESPDWGIRTEGKATVDFPRVMGRMRQTRARISAADSASRFTGLGVDIYFGEARFTSRHTLAVEDTRLEFSKAVIATGSRPAILAIPGLREAGFLTNETVFSLDQLPKTLLVIGAGPVGCELAQAFRRFGSDVTLVTNGMALLPRDDPDARRVLETRFQSEGIALVFNAHILRVEAGEGRKHLIFDCGQGEKTVSGDEILLAAGRYPALDGLNLEAAGVRKVNDGVGVDDHLRTSNPDIYAAGDVCSAYKFTHAAEAMARIVVQNALFFGRKRMSDLAIPWCTYTDPEIAHVGISAAEAAARQSEVAVFTREMAETDRAILDRETEGFVRLYARKRDGRLLGATLVGSHAGENIGELVLALRRRVKLSDLGSVIHPYPTQAEAIKRAAEMRLRARLTTRTRKILGMYWKVRR